MKLPRLACLALLAACTDGAIDPESADPVADPLAPRTEALDDAVAPLGMTSADLALHTARRDEIGNTHVRYHQKRGGLDVIGGELIVHVDRAGAIYDVTGDARSDLPEHTQVLLSAEEARRLATSDARFASLAPQGERLVYLQPAEGEARLAYEVVVAGARGPDPARDHVYVDAETGDLLAVYPQIAFLENRAIYSAQGATLLPGMLVRGEGSEPSGDADVDAAFANTGAFYDAFQSFFGRDSYDNAGATLVASVHYGTNYCNAFWTGTQLVFGDGNPAQSCGSLARATDVTAHELTHAMIANDAGLVFVGEAGGLNESLSDIFGAFVEAWAAGTGTGVLRITQNTWLVAEQALTPALRNMCDPAADGVSKDFWYPGIALAPIHQIAGVPNLAFCLLTNGGAHPRGKSLLQVAGIGMADAIRIFYYAEANLLTSTSTLAAARNATMQAAQALGYPQAIRDSVQNAWAAVGVGAGVIGPNTEWADGVLVNGVAATEVADAKDGLRYWRMDVPAGQTTLTFTISGGTGDADLYVRFGEKPTTTVYDCRPYLGGNNETCTFTAPVAGTYWVMLRGYTAYQGLTLKGTYVMADGVLALPNGVPVQGLSGTAGSQQFWKIAVPASTSVSVTISGGKGDADLHTRWGQKPTLTSWNCRPYLNGNNETCTSSAPATGGDLYIMVRGYTAFSGVSLVAAY